MCSSVSRSEFECMQSSIIVILALALALMIHETPLNHVVRYVILCINITKVTDHYFQIR